VLVSLRSAAQCRCAPVNSDVRDHVVTPSDKKLYAILVFGLVVGVTVITYKPREIEAALTTAQCSAGITPQWIAGRSDPTGPTHGMTEKEVETLASCYCAHLLARVTPAQLKLFAGSGEAAMADPSTRSAIEASMKACHPKRAGR
jgi:hypothetical protein